MSAKAIEIKGIVRNQTKIGVQDGQSEDLVNLRFKDGSWRVVDDGKHVYSLPEDYTQLYVHTNVYHHLLGVLNGKLWYFANIENDGETFTPLESPVEICDVQGDVTIVQNGHLLTIICAVDTDTTPLPLKGDEKEIKYAMFITGTKEYRVIKTDPNGEVTDRGLYPFGRVHLNLDCEYSEDMDFSDTNEDAGIIFPNYALGILNKDEDYGLIVAPKQKDKDASTALWYASMLKAYDKAKEKNAFTKPFLAIIAVKLYDGTHCYASNPILLSPREALTFNDYYINENGVKKMIEHEQGKAIYTRNGYFPVPYQSDGKDFYTTGQFSALHYIDVDNEFTKVNETPLFCSSASQYVREKDEDGVSTGRSTYLETHVYGSKLILTLQNLSHIINNPDVFSGLSIFITKEVDIFLQSGKYEDSEFYLYNKVSPKYDYTRHLNIAYRPKFRKYDEIIYDLINSPFYLLRDYSINELKSMSNTSTLVDLSAPEYEGLLKNITAQDKLKNESLDRRDFIPKVAYSYNQRLHIANYASNLFRGYPIDCFQLSNHNVKIEQGSYAVGGVLPNLNDGADVQYSREKIFFIDANDQEAERYIELGKQIGAYFAFVKVTIETQHGESEVIRYIAPYDAHMFKNGDKANFVEDLSPLLTYPDARAKKMEIKIASLIDQGQSVEWYGKVFELSPHPYLNLAYYIAPDLAPIQISEFDGGYCLLNEYDDYGVNEQFILPKESNSSESFPNGLKVSKVNNPFYFPNATTYQVGSAEIVALMSNAVAVGAGQTGAAPLYVFCKDGIYALLVDSSGELAYTNARIIARDVCNNAKSVTPIDSGVVFTTDRGLMEIAGNEVVEIGQIAEGDVFDITDNGNLPNYPTIADKAKKIMFNAFTMQQLAEFPQSLVDNTDFLTYLKGAIINYNHNERELMVSNPEKKYTYVMDRNGNWSRRAFTAQEYVNNYPTSYRVDKAGNFYKVDADDNDTNKVYLLSNVIKLGTIAFKQAYRLVVRGYFETTAYPSAFGYINEKLVRVEGSFIDRMEKGEELKMSYITKYGQSLWVNINDDSILSGGITIYDQLTNEDVTETIVSVDSGSYYTIQRTENNSTIGCYVFGSYDGRQWSLLGGNEKGGKFNDIGCKISHTDIKFIRFCIAGKLSHNSRIDFVEVEYDGSNLNTKLR